MQFLSKWESGSENGHTKPGMEPENASGEIVTVWAVVATGKEQRA